MSQAVQCPFGSAGTLEVQVGRYLYRASWRSCGLRWAVPHPFQGRNTGQATYSVILGADPRVNESRESLGAGRAWERTCGSVRGMERV